MARPRRLAPARRERSRRGAGARSALSRGDVYEAELPGGRHPVVVLTRDAAIPFLRAVVVAQVTSRVRGLPTEVALGPEEGLARECVVNCDNLYTVPKAELVVRRGALGPAKVRELRSALRISLELD